LITNLINRVQTFLSTTPKGKLSENGPRSPNLAIRKG
jgi:hypothetical protein